MKERPILFSAPMVRAILDGRKTQTRRVAKPVKHPDLGNLHDASVLAREPQHVIERACPYGQVGDRLWVRETHLAWWSLNPEAPDGPRVFSHVAAFKADGYELEPGEKWIPAIHMLRKASRIDLEITGVRVERLNDISEADAIDEGTEPLKTADGRYDWTVKPRGPIGDFKALWESINGAGSWEANPWVWVIGFKRIDAAKGE